MTHLLGDVFIAKSKVGERDPPTKFGGVDGASLDKRAYKEVMDPLVEVISKRRRRRATIGSILLNAFASSSSCLR